ncbi:MAG: TonB-dependent receptor [Thalassotalea sp.]|nr:TonB-dependent receptor [Thalassotalea sp.]
MKHTKFRKNKISTAIAIATISLSMPVFAEKVDEVEKKVETDFERIVVTGSPGGRSQIETAVSVTSLDTDAIEDFQPSSESEVFRMIPGIQVAGTAGPGGNSNIAVRGLPVATGGSPFVQIQEDGLPTVLFGDMNFGNNDYWTRFDASVDRVEGVRGGTAGTFTSQAPGAIINYISNHGDVDGGYIKLNKGIGFDENKIDFRYGGEASDSVYYHVGGYIKNGRGPLDAGYEVSNSAQIKANLTKYLDDGDSYLRFYLKLADTQEPNYTGAPALANYDGKSFSNIKPYPGFDGRTQSNYSIHNQNFNIVNTQGDLETVNMSGITTKAFAIGNEFHYELEDELILDNKFRWTKMSGAFTAPFLNLGSTASVIGSTVNGSEVAEIRYANGPSAGQIYNKEYLNNNTNVRTNMDDVGSFVNDLAISKELEFDAGTLSLRGGYFYFKQDIASDWHTNRTFSELSGSDPAMLDLFDSADNQLTANGIAGFNDNWGDCCSRNYDLAYTNTAPYVSLDFEADDFTLDVSTRRETVDASGWTVQGGSVVQTDVNGVMIPALLSNGARESLDYSESYTSWTVGGLYKVNEDNSVFSRASEGGRFNSDRQIVSGKINPDGSLNEAGKAAAVDFVNQYEIGFKHRGDIFEGDGYYTLEVTLLKGDFKQSTYELSATKCGGAGGCIIDAEYKSQGAEILGTLNYNGLTIVGNATVTDAEKLSSEPGSSWTRADGIPDIMYTVSSNYEITDELQVGLNVTGQTDSVDNAGNEWPAAMTFGGHIRYDLTENLQVGISGYNLTDKFDLRGNGGAVNTSGSQAVISGAPAIGRTLIASVKFNF